MTGPTPGDLVRLPCRQLGVVIRVGEIVIVRAKDGVLVEVPRDALRQTDARKWAASEVRVPLSQEFDR